MVRYSIGEEYEMKLKKMARDASLIFFDEGDLRREGFDKTPDLLLAVQCLYKNTIINWIESKASFGDSESHSKYLKEQLNCYENRFGSGIVIYWFGFEKSLILNPRRSGLIVLDDFPEKALLTTFKTLYSISRSDYE
jgi:CDAN1-interacting nuclease 1